MYKKYDLPAVELRGYRIDTAAPNPQVAKYSTRIDQGWMWTYGNYRWQDPPPNSNVGSLLPWSQAKLERWYEPTESVHISRGTGYPNQLQYKGTLVAKPKSLAALTVVQDGSAWGAEAYDRMKPTKPEFQSLNALYELKDLPSMLRQRFHDQGLRGISDYWLAIQFGWRPLLKDVLTMVTIQRALEKRFDQLLRDNGRPVRRRITLASDSTYSYYGPAGDYGAFTEQFVTQFYSGSPTYAQTLKVTDKVWASARFRFWLPKGPGNVVWKKAVMAKLMGLYPSPKFVYDAVPWSWLIDWFSNAGHVLSNLDASGVASRLAADYFYVMREREEHYTSFATGTFYQHSPGNPKVRLKAATHDVRTSRSRLRGDPFGFNTAQSDLSSMQLSILGALAMSRR